MTHKSVLKAIFLLLLCFAGCKQKDDVDITGTWQTTVVFEQQLAAQDDEDAVIATVKISQENSFDFRDDGSFSRTVRNHFLNARVFSENISEESLRTLYEDTESEMQGTYKVTGDILTLFVEDSPASKLKLEAESIDRISFDGILFSRK